MIPRLYSPEPLYEKAIIPIERDAFHYLKNVLRLQENAEVRLFNGKDGEWEAHLTDLGKKNGSFLCINRLAEQRSMPPITMMCSLIKPSRMEILLEKATELGVTHIQPIVTEYCNVRKFNMDRARAQTLEASEQSERMDIPEILPLLSLQEAIAKQKGHILWADETRDQKHSITKELAKSQVSGLLTGPEGGFSEKEKAFLQAQPHVIPVHLGPLILRAETAGIVLLALYQAQTEAWR